MSKSKISIKNIRKYFRELSVVVIGVAITLSASNWISNRTEKRNLALYLNAIILELETNAESFELQAKKFQKSVKYANYIKLYDEKSINQDTVWYYAQSNDDGCGWGLIRSEILYSKNAFEMLKTSGVMRFVDDKELLLSISGVYIAMENTQKFLDMCFQRKAEEFTKEWYQMKEGKNITIPMQFFYCYDLPLAMMQTCKDMTELINETLSKLMEVKIIKP